MPYPTRSCVVIKPAVTFIGFLVQLGLFGCSKLNNDQQRVVYELLFGEFSCGEIPTPTINHDCTVKIDGVVKIGVNKINGISDNIERDNFQSKCSNRIKELIFLMKLQR